MSSIFDFDGAPAFAIKTPEEYESHLQKIVDMWGGKIFDEKYNVVAWKHSVMMYEEANGLERKCARLCNEVLGIQQPST